MIGGVSKVFIFVLGCGACFCAAAQKPRVDFVPPRLIYAGDISFPEDTAAAGLVQLAVDLDKDGYVRSVHTVRDVPSLTATAVDAVTGWTFSPAFLDGNAVPSTIAVSVLFDSGSLPKKKVPLTPADRSWESDHPSYIPPGISSAWFAAYPPDGPPATVVLGVIVNRAGEVSRSAAVYNVPSLTRSVVTAVSLWKFTPATFRRTRIVGNSAAAFVFRAPEIRQGP